MSIPSKDDIGKRASVTADNWGGDATIIDYRDTEGSPASYYKVRMDQDGQEFWAFDFEVDIYE